MHPEEAGHREIANDINYTIISINASPHTIALLRRNKKAYAEI
jgi:hypothetical protein